MSRSNPTDYTPNPAAIFFEWQGSDGVIRYYDKEGGDDQGGEQVVIGDKFTFIVLDELATVSGWHKKSGSGIYSNEIRDTRSEPLVVKAFKGGIIAEGFYAQIKDRIEVRGGHFVANIYIATKVDGKLTLCALQFHGKTLNAWVDFRKENRKDVYKKAVRIDGWNEGKKGTIVYRTPKFFIKDLSEETNTAAMVLDQELQQYLEGYFKRTRVEQAQPRPVEEEDVSQEAMTGEPTHGEPPPGRSRHFEEQREPEPYDDDDIPF